MTVAGWYPDPDNSVRQRYWDGVAWTAQLRPKAGGADSWRAAGQISPGAAVASPQPRRSNGLRNGWLIAGGIAIFLLFASCSAGTRLWQMGVDGTGYNVTCMDGTHSKSGGNQGACSQHGGVR